MINKKLIALFVAVATVSAISAEYGDCYIDPDTNRKHCRDVVEPVRATGEFAVDTTKNAGETAANILSFGGYSKHKAERREDERETRRERRARRYNDYRD